MKYYKAFLKKEWMEAFRTGKFFLLTILFFLFGIMNPAIAKLTPKLFEMMADTMKESGIMLGEVTVNAMSSWEQYYKNIPMVLIAFVLIFAGIVGNEYQKGTLILAVSKGASKTAILSAKTTIVMAIWTIGYILYYIVTYSYNAYFWDNSIAKNCFFGAFLFWLFGIHIITCMMLAATIGTASSSAMLGTGAYVAVLYFIGLVPKTAKYNPVKLMDGLNLLKGVEEITDYVPAIVVTVVLSVVFFVLSRIVISKKQF